MEHLNSRLFTIILITLSCYFCERHPDNEIKSSDPIEFDLKSPTEELELVKIYFENLTSEITVNHPKEQKFHALLKLFSEHCTIIVRAQKIQDRDIFEGPARYQQKIPTAWFIADVNIKERDYDPNDTNHLHSHRWSGFIIIPKSIEVSQEDFRFAKSPMYDRMRADQCQLQAVMLNADKCYLQPLDRSLYSCN